jgi:hypothetical protein
MDISISSRVDFIAYAPGAKIKHGLGVRKLKPGPATLTLFVNVGQLVLFTIVVADSNWKGMPYRPLNLPTVHADRYIGMCLTLRNLDGEGFHFPEVGFPARGK